MTFKRWDVISVPFPFVEGYESKRRPALVISTDDFHKAHDACFSAMITTARNMRDMRDGDVKVIDLAKAGLPAPCVVRLSRLATFEASNQIRRIGSLGTGERRAVSGRLKRWLGV